MTVQLSMDRIQVGQYLPGCRTHGRYVRAELAEGMWRVFVGVPTMTSDELAQFRGGVIRCAPVAEAGRLLFLLVDHGRIGFIGEIADDFDAQMLDYAETFGLVRM